MGGGCEEGRRMDSMICPKPRRICLLNPSINDSIRPSRWPANCQQSDCGHPKAGTELLDIILNKGSYVTEKTVGNQVASSPPYYCGSPPTRSSNPLIQDYEFVKEKEKEKLALFTQTPPSPSSRMGGGGGGGCVRVKFGYRPAPVRIEGFDCLSRDRRNPSISAVA